MEVQPDINPEPVQLDQPSARAARGRIVAQLCGQVYIYFIFPMLSTLVMEHYFVGLLFLEKKKEKR